MNQLVMKPLLILAISLNLAACGGGDSTPATSAADANGIWSGRGTAKNGTSYDVFLIAQDGKIWGLSNEQGISYQGNVSVQGQAASGSIKLYQYGTGATETITYNANLVPKTSLNVIDSNGGTANLAYDSEYDYPVTYTELAGTYTLNVSGYNLTTVINLDGTFIGSDSQGCTYTGRFTQINNKNVFNVSTRISVCFSATYTGIGGYDPVGQGFGIFLDTPSNGLALLAGRK